jgi:very-short-patch-repair endonuclease
VLKYEPWLKKYSRDLRKNMTDAEMHLWDKLRRKQLKGRQFFRQRPIGSYIVDFYCPTAKLIIEVDGGQHYYGEGAEKDKLRDEFMKKQGFKVLRFSDLEVLKSTKEVLETIFELL